MVRDKLHSYSRIDYNTLPQPQPVRDSLTHEPLSPPVPDKPSTARALPTENVDHPHRSLELGNRIYVTRCRRTCAIDLSRCSTKRSLVRAAIE